MPTTPYLGEVMIFAGTFAPRGWAYCNGQLLPISSNTALFSLLGTTYGGDGRTTFGLPDLRGRVPINSGGNSTGPGLSNYRLGAKGGAERITLTINQIPSHTHVMKTSTKQGDTMDPNGAFLANYGTTTPSEGPFVKNTPNATEQLNAGAIANTGGGQQVENRQPFLAINYCIAITGTYPSRS